MVAKYKEVYTKQKLAFPQDPLEQLRASINAVFMSWEAERAIVYRQLNQITGLAGTAVNVQASSASCSNEIDASEHWKQR